jgi:hypothetical protein
MCAFGKVVAIETGLATNATSTPNRTLALEFQPAGRADKWLMTYGSSNNQSSPEPRVDETTNQHNRLNT